jgi:hypothetical protein
VAGTSLGESVFNYWKSSIPNEKALYIEGRFSEKGALSGSSEAVITREYTFTATISTSLDNLIEINFNPAKTLRIGPPQSYAYWNARMGFDGSQWCIQESSKKRNIDELKSTALNRLIITYVPPLELGQPGRSLLTFDKLLPIHMLFPVGGAPKSIRQILNDPHLKVNEVGAELSLTYDFACLKGVFIFDKSKGYAFKSQTIINNCNSEPLLDETVAGEYQNLDGFWVPHTFTRKISNGNSILAKSQLSLSKICFINYEKLKNSVSELTKNLGTMDVIDERTGGEYFLNKDSITIDSLPR